MGKEKIDNTDMARNKMQKTQNTTHQFMLFLPSIKCHHDETQPREGSERVEVKHKTHRNLFTRQT